ncbi:MAG: hypothetical protein ACUVQZ_04090 [Candidatus Caldatribacteriaceae bacterium]
MEKIVKRKGGINVENIRFLLQYLCPYRKATLLAPLLMVLEVFCDLAQPRLLAQMVDAGIIKGDGNFIFRTGILMGGSPF